MKRIILICQRNSDEMDVKHGLDNIRNYTLQQDDLKDKVEIEILLPNLNKPLNDIAGHVIDKAPDMVGLSTFIWTVFDNIKFAEKIKKHLPETKIILGGPQVSHTHWDIMQYTSNVDGVIRGEGEIVFSEMLRFWLANGNLYSRDIQSFSYRDPAGGIVHNPDRPPVKNMDIIPFRFKNMEADPNHTYFLETTRGCYNICGYCAWGSMPFRMHSVEYALEEIDNMAKAGVKRVCILDTSFTVDRLRMEKISRRLGEYGISYFCCAKAEEINPEMMDILLETGATKIEFGLQSINPEALALMKRKLNKDLYEKNVRMLVDKSKGRDVEVSIDMICGLPGDNLKAFCQGMDFAYSLKPHRVSAFPLHLLPGTDFYVNHEKYGIRHIPFIHEMKHTKDVYNMHEFGLVLENATFSKEELKRGCCICLFSLLLADSGLIKRVYNILDNHGITFTQFYNRIESYLPENFFDCLASEPDLENRRYIWSSAKEAFSQYDSAFDTRQEA